MRTLILFLISFNLFAAPFIVGDPVPKDNRVPTSYVVTLNGTVYTVLPEDMGDTVRFKIDMADKLVMGANNMSVVAKNMFGESEAAPFLFTIEIPLTPTGLRFVE